MGGNGDDIGFSIALDNSSNVLITGQFSTSVDFDPGIDTYNITSEGSWDGFISKLDSSGNFIWAKQIGGVNYDMSRKIVLDILGNIYTTGWFYDDVDFDPGAGVFNLTSGGGSDIFISKLNAFGNFVWAKQIGGISNDFCGPLHVDDSGNIFSIGNFSDSVDFDFGLSAYNLVSMGEGDIFIANYNESTNSTYENTVTQFNIRPLS